MDKETLEALRGSIQKWENIVAGTGVDDGMDNCPLCQMFFDEDEICTGCPVAIESTAPLCFNTPYSSWRVIQLSAWGVDNHESKVFSSKSMTAAIAMLNYLKSLLPEGE